MNGKGVVTSREGIKAKVKVTIGSECMNCQSRSNCFGKVPDGREITVINDYGANVSDNVVFEADTWKVILSATLIWIIPLLSMIAGYVVARRFAEGFLPIGAAFIFLCFSFVVLRLIDNAVSGGRTFYPRITKITDSSKAASAYCDTSNDIVKRKKT